MRQPPPCLVGYLQFDVELGDIQLNLDRVTEGLARLFADKGATANGLVVLPEMWATGFAFQDLPVLAERTPEILNRLGELARLYQIYVAGSLPEHAGGGIYNTLYVTGPAGTVGTYRKQHLFGPIQEDINLRPGNSPQPIATPIGTLGCLVCYDLRFPDLGRLQAGGGADILLVSAQWPLARKEHWRTLLQARAIENQIYVVAANRCGTDKTGNRLTFAGHSMIIGPDGTILREAGENAALAAMEIGGEPLTAVRHRFNTVAPTPYRFADADKIVALGTLTQKVKAYKKVGRKVVFTNGCFDILHSGHVTYLEAARRMGDCLLVGLNSDRSVRAIKGPERPINNQGERARVLAALGCVDHVVLFDDDTPLTMINKLLPDVLVKGADWNEADIVGGREVREAGGRIVRIPFVEGASTTELIKRIRQP